MSDNGSSWVKPENVISAELHCVAEFHLFTPERWEKGQGCRGIKAGKGDAAREKLCWKDECGLWPFPSFLCRAYWEFISAVPAAVVALPSPYLERARPKITVCSLYPRLRAGVLADASSSSTSVWKLYLRLVLSYTVTSVFMWCVFNSLLPVREPYSCYGGGVNQSCSFSVIM